MTSMIKNAKRYEGIDLLRAIAILLILFVHIHRFIPITDSYLINNIGEDVTKYLIMVSDYLGVSLFFFISGFSIHINNYNINKFLFIKKRFKRIYPLYIISIVFLLISFKLFPHEAYSQTYNNKDIIIYILCIQELVRPFIEFNQMPALWFINAILVMYAIYSIISKKYLEINALIILFILFLINFFLKNYIKMFIIYYAVFIAGILFANNQIYNRNRNININKFFYLIIILFIIFFITAVIFMGKLDLWIELIVISSLLIGSCFLMYVISSKISNIIDEDISIFINNISLSSYAIYLFHIPLLTLFSGSLRIFGINEALIELLIITIGIPLTVFICTCIYRLDKKFIMK